MTSFFASEAERLRHFPIAAKKIFLGHGGVTALPAGAASAMQAQVAASCENHQEFGEVLRDIQKTRITCARLIGARSEEIALLGPTSLGLSLFANGIDWQPGDEVVYYPDDYPANVYPWKNLENRGVVLRPLQTPQTGRVTPESVVAALSSKTKLVALASCHYLTGWRIDVPAIGSLLKEREILFSLDAIQTLGAFPTEVSDHVDFLSADAHKWMLGPLAIGIVYVAKRNFEICRPTLLGAWNIHSPEFIAQDTIRFVETAQRYEPGVLNVVGIYGMKASLDLLMEHGVDRVGARIQALHDYLYEALAKRGYVFLSPSPSESLRSGILTTQHPEKNPTEQFKLLEAANVVASLRSEGSGRKWLRFSPHFYNTEAELDRVIEILH